jgi:hypothetical protein
MMHVRLRKAARAQLIFSFRKILKPLIRILLRAGITYEDFREVIKGAYVEAAVRDGIRGHPGAPTKEAYSAYTGVPVEDVANLISDDSLLAPPDVTNEAIITEVLHLWCTDTDYVGPYGLPLELDFDDTPERNLTVLINRSAPDADPKVILQEMLDYSVIKRVGSRHFRAGSRINLHADLMTPQALEHFGRTITDLSNTIEYNMGAPAAARRVQRSVSADGGLPEYALPEFEALLKDKVQKTLLEIDDWLASNRSRWSKSDKTIPTGLSVYHYVADPFDTTPLSHLQPVQRKKEPRFRVWRGKSELDEEDDSTA